MIHSILLENLSYFHISCLLILVTIQIWRFYSSRGKLWYAKTKSNLAILNSCPSIFKGNFSPSIYLQHKLLQSKFATFLPSMAEYVDFDFEEITMPNGGHTNIAWPNNVKVKKNVDKRSNTLVLILPGVTGSAGDNYIKDLIHLLADEGYECCVYLPRFNCKEIVMPHNGHNDIVEDFKNALDYIMKKRKNMKIFGLGHSYGANLMINYLGKHQEENRFIGVVSIANPLNFILSEIRVRNCLIEKAITKTLLRNINRSSKLLAEVERLGIDIDDLRTQTSMRGFDRHWSLKVYGHNSVTDLHWDISSIRRLKHVKLPIFMLSAEDDPIIDPKVITKTEIENECPNVIYKTTPKGGHLGWIYGFFKLTRWYPKPTIEFINAVVDMKM